VNVRIRACGWAPRSIAVNGLFEGLWLRNLPLGTRQITQEPEPLGGGHIASEHLPASFISGRELPLYVGHQHFAFLFFSHVASLKTSASPCKVTNRLPVDAEENKGRRTQEMFNAATALTCPLAIPKMLPNGLGA